MSKSGLFKVSKHRKNRIVCVVASKTAAGFSMVELMIALALGLLLTAAVLQTFISLKRTYEFQEEFSRIQENGRFAMEFLSRDIRRADYWGCLGGTTDITNDVNASSSATFSFGAGVEGTDEGSPYIPATGDRPDSITLRGADGTGIQVTTPYMPTPASALHVTNASSIEQADIVLVSDCVAGDIFQKTNPTHATLLNHNSGGSTNPGNNTGDLSKTYRGDARVYQPFSYTYHIDTGTSGEPALFRNTTEELVEGIENFQVLYGEDVGSSDGVPDYFVPADHIVDMDDVVSVMVTVVVRSVRDNLTDTAQSFELNGTTYTPSDRRIRKVFSTKVAVRNRLD